MSAARQAEIEFVRRLRREWKRRPSAPYVRSGPSPSCKLERLTYRPAEVAALLGVPLRTVYRWTADGKLRAIRRGRVVLIDVSSVAAFMGSAASKESHSPELDEAIRETLRRLG